MSIEEAIAQSQLFGSLPARDIESLATLALRKSFARDEIIFNEGDEAGGFYMLEKGKVKIYKLSQSGREQILHVVKPGEVFGEAAVFSVGRYPAFARALEESSAVFFMGDRFSAEVRANPQLALHMLGAMARHLRRFASLVEQLSLKSARARLAEYLLAQPADASGTIDLDITKREIAAHLGTKPETLSRALGALQDEKVIEVDGGRVTVADSEKLELLAGGEE